MLHKAVCVGKEVFVSVVDVRKDCLQPFIIFRIFEIHPLKVGVSLPRMPESVEPSFQIVEEGSILLINPDIQKLSQVLKVVGVAELDGNRGIYTRKSWFQGTNVITNHNLEWILNSLDEVKELVEGVLILGWG